MFFKHEDSQKLAQILTHIIKIQQHISRDDADKHEITKNIDLIFEILSTLPKRVESLDKKINALAPKKEPQKKK